jgi:hypothetical protein
MEIPSPHERRITTAEGFHPGGGTKRNWRKDRKNDSRLLLHAIEADPTWINFLKERDRNPKECSPKFSLHSGAAVDRAHSTVPS